VSKSLVAVQPTDLGTRYRLLETTRAQALEQLDDHGEREQLARRHAEYYRDVFERAEAETARRPMVEWLSDYRWQVDNLRAALDWAFSPDGDPSTGVALTAAATPLWLHLSLLEECRSRVGQALTAIERGAGRDARPEMKLNAALGSALIYATDGEISAAWTKTIDLAERLDDAEYQLRSLSGLWLHHSVAGRHRVALALAQRFCSLTTNNPDGKDWLVGEHMIGVSYFYMGNLAHARHHFERVLADSAAPDPRVDFIRFEMDSRIRVGGFLAWILWLQGFPDQAVRTAESNVAAAVATDHAVTLCYALIQASVIALTVGNLAAAERHFTRLLDKPTMDALTRWRGFGLCYQGVLAIAHGDIATGLRRLREGSAERGVARFAVLRFIAVQIAEAFGRAGQVSAGLAVVEEATELVEERWQVAGLLRSRGNLLLLQDAPGAAAAAEDRFRQALAEARQQGALSWELQASISVAQLLRDQGRSADASTLLRPVFDKFTEGFDTADLKTAQALLNALR
jgi:predicted ATPase